MKGTITRCMAQLVSSQFGSDRWEDLLDAADISPATRATLRLPTADVDDREVGALLSAAARVLGMSSQQIYDAFGRYWCCEYAPQVYRAILKRFGCAREMILGMDQVHVEMTSDMEDARPPRFHYRWESENTLCVEYRSSRNLIGVFAGLARGVGVYFDEPLTVTARSDSELEIVFG